MFVYVHLPHSSQLAKGPCTVAAAATLAVVPRLAQLRLSSHNSSDWLSCNCVGKAVLLKLCCRAPGLWLCRAQICCPAPLFALFPAPLPTLMTCCV